MTPTEIAQIISSCGVGAFAWLVYQELRLLRPILQAVVLHLASQSSPEERAKARALTPPIGTRPNTEPGNSS